MSRNALRSSSALFALTLVLPTALSAQTSDYFPDGVFGPANVHAHSVGWFSSHLRAMGEPSLYAQRNRGRHVVRFLRLPTWGHPVAIRIEREGDRVTLARCELSGHGGYDPGTVASRAGRSLTIADWRAIERAFEGAGGWSAPPIVARRGRDGEEWIVERVDGERYQVMDRWTPEGDPASAAFVRLCGDIERLAAGAR